MKKGTNPMTVKAKTATVKYKALSKKNQTLAVGKVLTVKKNQGKVTYVKKSGNKSMKDRCVFLLCRQCRPVSKSLTIYRDMHSYISYNMS